MATDGDNFMALDLISKLHNYSVYQDILMERQYGGNEALRNVGILPQHYTTSQPRRPRLESSSFRSFSHSVSLPSTYQGISHTNYWG